MSFLPECFSLICGVQSLDNIQGCTKYFKPPFKILNIIRNAEKKKIHCIAEMNFNKQYGVQQIDRTYARLLK